MSADHDGYRRAPCSTPGCLLQLGHPGGHTPYLTLADALVEMTASLNELADQRARADQAEAELAECREHERLGAAQAELAAERARADRAEAGWEDAEQVIRNLSRLP